jgi:hypothetical protein
VVRELWGARGLAAVEAPAAVTPTAVTPAAVTPPADPSQSSGARVNAPLDLFRFLRPSARGAA